MVSAEKSFTGRENRATMRPTMARKHRHTFPEHPLARWRQVHGLSQQALGSACGMSPSMIAMIETYARVPIRERLDALLDYTHLPTDALVRPLRFLDAHPEFPYSQHPPAAQP